MDSRNNDYVGFDSFEVNSNDADTTDVEFYDDEDNDYSKSSGEQSLNDGDDADENDDAVSADRSVSKNSITADEIRAMDFGSVQEAYEFYCNYAKGIGFAVRKGDIRTRGPEGNKRVVMRQFVCNKHGFRLNKHLSRIDRKREHRRLTRTNCGARLRVHYKGDDAAVGTQNSAVRDPEVVKCKGAPKKKKNEAKGLRQCTICKDTTHNARTCLGKNKATGEHNVEAEPTSVNNSVSQVGKSKKGKTTVNCERSSQKKCSKPPKYHGDTVTTTRHMDVTSINRQIHPMYGVQPYMPMVHPVMQPMHAPPPMYPIYGMSIGQNSNSCYGLLQQVMKSAGQD